MSISKVDFRNFMRFFYLFLKIDIFRKNKTFFLEKNVLFFQKNLKGLSPPHPLVPVLPEHPPNAAAPAPAAAAALAPAAGAGAAAAAFAFFAMLLISWEYDTQSCAQGLLVA